MGRELDVSLRLHDAWSLHWRLRCGIHAMRGEGRPKMRHHRHLAGFEIVFVWVRRRRLHRYVRTGRDAMLRRHLADVRQRRRVADDQHMPVRLHGRRNVFGRLCPRRDAVLDHGVDSDAADLRRNGRLGQRCTMRSALS